MSQKLILILGFLFPAFVSFAFAQAKLPTSPCEINVAELPVLAGATFDMKMEDVKKHYKTVRVLSPPKNEIMGQTRIHMLRPLVADEVFKNDLLTVDLAHSSLFGITSIALNFRPKTKLTPAELFSKITLETGLPSSNWAYNDFGGKANYRKWDVVCNDFSGSFIAQTGYMNRLTIWRNPSSDLKKKPIDNKNIGD
jgi:hypothetical protein